MPIVKIFISKLQQTLQFSRNTIYKIVLTYNHRNILHQNDGNLRYQTSTLSSIDLTQTQLPLKFQKAQKLFIAKNKGPALRVPFAIPHPRSVALIHEGVTGPRVSRWPRSRLPRDYNLP